MAKRQSAKVVSIIDGDTIDVDLNGQTYRVRYILVDTPERGMPYFSEATEANRKLVANKTVHLEKDVSETDRYDRLLRYVYLEDGTFVNRELVLLGYAQLATFPPDVSKVEEIRAAQQEAIAAGRGLWASEASPEQPPAAAPVGPVVAQNANLRGGPGTNYGVVGGLKAGDPVQVVASNPAGDWYQLVDGSWIAAFLVNNAPGGLPVVQVAAPPTSTPAPVAPTNTPVIVQQPQQPVPPVQQPQPAQNCDPSYPTVCIAPYPPDLNCPQIPYRRFQVVGADPHGFDGDNDGVGCESG